MACLVCAFPRALSASLLRPAARITTAVVLRQVSSDCRLLWQRELIVLEAVLGTSSAPARMCVNAMTAPCRLTPTTPTSVMLQSRMLWLLRGATAAETLATNDPQGSQQQDVPALEGPHLSLIHI